LRFRINFLFTQAPLLLGVLLLGATLVESASTSTAESVESTTAEAVRRLLDVRDSLEQVPFADVIAATSGKKVLPFDPNDPVCRRIQQAVTSASNELLRQLNDNAQLQEIPRINEVSMYVENLFQTLLNAQPGFSCDFPKTAEGNVQRSGYPDLRLVDVQSGRVSYVDPKLYAKGSEDSSFRTFYFEPKTRTNKVLEDAHHLTVGIEHERTPDGLWRFVRWQLVDLAAFKVRLKAEFEGSNRALYRPEAVVDTGPD
jgi:hypothetical protein